MNFTADMPRLAVVAKLLPPEAMSMFVEAANARGGEFNDGISAGWAVVNKLFERRDGKGRYVRKMNPTPSDVHVDAIMGSKPKKKPEYYDIGEMPDVHETKKTTGTLYVHRPLKNGDAIRAWARAQGIESTLPVDDMHVTICHSKAEVDWDEFTIDTNDLVVPAVDGFEKKTRADDLMIADLMIDRLFDLDADNPWFGQTAEGVTPLSVKKSDRVAKFNPNHDEIGRFTFAEGSYGVVPGDLEKFKALKAEWAKVNNELLAHVDEPDGNDSAAAMEKLKGLSKQMQALRADPGGARGMGLPGGPRDVVIVGAGPGGLAAGINGAAEGLDTVVIEGNVVPGGQAKFSSRIENFPGFPIGVTGERLTQDMFDQAQRLGAETMLGTRVTGMAYDPVTGLKTLSLSDGREIAARSVIMSGGLEFRRMDFPGADGPGVFVGDGKALANAGAGGDVTVIGGSNGAAQAALGAARSANRVTLMSRSPIDDSMSDYQVSALRNRSNVTVIEGDSIASLSRDASGNPVSIRTTNGRNIKSKAVGVFIGSVPDTKWVPDRISLAKGGRIKTNGDFETDVPGVYAIGDVRDGAVGRVGVAVGEGQLALRNANMFLWKHREAAKVQKSSARSIHQFPARTTPNGALVLKFESEALHKRWEEFRSEGASWDFPEYQPHITITYSVPNADVSKIEPYAGPLVFGGEVFGPLNENWANEIKEEPTTEGHVEKKLGPGSTVEDYIHDFVHSTNSRFAGKSKEERIRMALGAWYSANKALLVEKYNPNHDERGRFATGRYGDTRAERGSAGDLPRREPAAQLSRGELNELEEHAQHLLDDRDFHFDAYLYANPLGSEKGRAYARGLIRDVLDGKVKAKWVGAKPGESHWKDVVTDIDDGGLVTKATVVKLDDEQRIVYGWASVVTVKGQPVLDRHHDIIEPDVMEKAATEFMKGARTHAAMHRTAWVIEDGDLVRKAVEIGTIVHSFPITNTLFGKLFGTTPSMEGWIIGAYVKNDAEWAKYKDGTYKSFSIGGQSMFHPLNA